MKWLAPINGKRANLKDGVAITRPNRGIANVAMSPARAGDIVSILSIEKC